VVVGILVGHLGIEKRERALSPKHTRYALAVMHTLGDDCETRTRRMVAVRRH